jgi:hypothetical protein
MTQTNTDSKKPSWLNTGYDGIKQEDQRLAALYGPNRFWMPAGVPPKEVVFVDAKPATLYEHNPNLNGDWKNWLTCQLNCFDEVVCCEILASRDYGRYFVGYYTVVDCSEWIDKKGTKYQYELKFFPAKQKTLKKFEIKHKDRLAEQEKEGQPLTGVAGCLYKASRADAKSPTCGDEFEFKRMVNMEKLFDLANYKGKKLSDLFAKANESTEAMEALKRTFAVELDENGKVKMKLVPFNYEQLLKPHTPAEMRTLLGSAKIAPREPDGSDGGGSSGGSTGGGKADEDIPF